MKLIRLHIENFGGLSGYDLEFEDGVTVICRENGFGKTTLAEFIRAMFYGFPRKGKNLEKSRRQKYMPWNGGKYGGYLIFSLEDGNYRLERTFGTTPKGDTFTLIDLGNNRKSDRFTDQIGLELFQLDGDSFERSTYMPQIRDLESLTTDGIQAKLGNLVEDPGDMGSFDKAMTALKTARSGYIPYRGNGGAVAEAKNQVSQLREELTRTQRKRQELEETQKEMEQIRENRDRTRVAREQVHQRILRASEAAAVEAAHREYRQLQNREAEADGLLKRLDERYGSVLPTPVEVSRVQELVRELPVYEEKAAPTEKEGEAARFLEENRDFFRDRIPEPEELETCRQQISLRNQLKTERETIGLSQQEKDHYGLLDNLAAEGKLEENRLKDLEDKKKALDQLEFDLSAAGLPEAEQVRLEKLRAFFAPGVPETETINRCRETLARIRAMSRENEGRLDELSREPAKSTGIGRVLVLAVLAAVLLITGVGLMLLERGIYGMVALGAGAAAMLGVLVMGISLGTARKRENLHRRQIREAMEQASEQIRYGRDTVRSFTMPYCGDQEAGEALYKILDNREELLTLAEREKAALAVQEELRTNVAALRTELARELGDGEPGPRLLQLRIDRAEYLRLCQELEQVKEKLETLSREEMELDEKIRSLLGTYYGDAAPEAYHSLLTELQRKRDAWYGSCGQLAAWEQRRKEQQEKAKNAREEIGAFFRKWKLELREDPQGQLDAIREDIRIWEEASRARSRFREEREAYEANHEKELAQTPAEQREDPEMLRGEAQELTQRENALSERYLAHKQRQSQLQQELGTLEQLQEELELWQEKWEQGKENARILDDTMGFLEKARESLQCSYLGPVRDSFAGYMKELLGEDPQKILLTPDLDVSLERAGQARELGYFSMGQAETVMLCMRLALVDALFGETSPLLILDDPFVNLDDARAKQALELLNKIGKTKQILYLSCSASRI